MLHIESFEAALYTQLVVNSTCDGTWSMLHRTSSLPQAIYIPRCSTMRPWLPGWHLRQLSWKSMVCRPSVGFGVFRAGDSFLNLCGLWRMGHPYKLGFKKVIWPSDQGNDFFGEWIKWVSFWGFHPKTMCLWWFLFPEGSTQIFFIFWIWPSIATCMPVHSWSTRMTIHSSKGGAGMRDSKRYIACMSNGVQTTESHLNVENHGTDGLQIFKGFH